MSAWLKEVGVGGGGGQGCVWIDVFSVVTETDSSFFVWQNQAGVEMWKSLMLKLYKINYNIRFSDINLQPAVQK